MNRLLVWYALFAINLISLIHRAYQHSWWIILPLVALLVCLWMLDRHTRLDEQHR